MRATPLRTSPLRFQVGEASQTCRKHRSRVWKSQREGVSDRRRLTRLRTLDRAKKKPAYRAMFSTELARIRAMKLAGQLSEVARIGPMTAAGNQNAGNRGPKAKADPCSRT